MPFLQQYHLLIPGLVLENVMLQTSSQKSIGIPGFFFFLMHGSFPGIFETETIFCIFLPKLFHLCSKFSYVVCVAFFIMSREVFSFLGLARISS